MRIIIADEYAIVREGLKHLFEAELLLDVVAEVTDMKELKSDLERLDPDLILLDCRIPECDLFTLTSYIRDYHINTKLLVYTTIQSIPLIKDILEHAVDGLVLKQDSIAELRLAISHISRGYRYISSSVRNCLNNLESSLTTREMQILNLIIQGFPRSQIAEQLAVSPETIKSHRKNLMRKLNVQSGIELLERARSLNF